MHPKLQQFIETFEREAEKSGSYRNNLGKYELLFLEQVWGPAFHFNYDGLHAEYPFLDHKGGHRFADFVYVKNGMRLVVEIDDLQSHARNVSQGDFSDHLSRQNDLVLSGWLILRFSAIQVAKHQQHCIAQLKQAIGHWWALAYSGDNVGINKLWDIRKSLVVHMAKRRDGKIKPSELAKEFNVSNRTAINWLSRFENEGILSRQPAQHRTTVYRLSSHSE